VLSLNHFLCRSRNGGQQLTFIFYSTVCYFMLFRWWNISWLTRKNCSHSSPLDSYLVHLESSNTLTVHKFQEEYFSSGTLYSSLKTSRIAARRFNALDPLGYVPHHVSVPSCLQGKMTRSYHLNIQGCSSALPGQLS
jgi:hypothetical protein